MKTTSIKRDDDLAALLPPLGDDEFGALTELVIKGGVEQPLVIWKETGILLDGHNRLAIAESEGIADVPVLEKSFPSRPAAEAWMIQNQIGRRNLAPGICITLVKRIEGEVKKQAKERQREAGGDRTSQDAKKRLSSIEDKRSAPPKGKRTVDVVAGVAGVSPSMVSKYDYVEKHGDPDLVKAMKKAEITINKAYEQTRVAAQERGQESLARAAAAVGVSPRSVSDAKRLKRDDPEMFEQVRAGKVTLNLAKKMAAAKRSDKPATSNGLAPGVKRLPSISRAEQLGKIVTQFSTLADITAATDFTNLIGAPEMNEAIDGMRAVIKSLNRFCRDHGGGCHKDIARNGGRVYISETKWDAIQSQVDTLVQMTKSGNVSSWGTNTIRTAISGLASLLGRAPGGSAT